MAHNQKHRLHSTSLFAKAALRSLRPFRLHLASASGTPAVQGSAEGVSVARRLARQEFVGGSPGVSSDILGKGERG